MMKRYLKKGVCLENQNFFDCDNEFYIQEVINSSVKEYSYPGSSIKHEIESEILKLYDKFRDLIFENLDDYYRELDTLPIFVSNAGLNSDCPCDVQLFQKYIQESENSVDNLYKYLYLEDYGFLLSTIRNLLVSMDYAFVNYFIQICNINMDLTKINNENTIWTVSSYESSCILSLLESYFTKAYSILDILTKIAYELQKMNNNYESYNKVECKNILWGDRKKLLINKTIGTVFERSNTIKIIESIRNEVVHNGSLEQVPKIFILIKDKKIMERFMLFPDFNDGNLATFKNRNHFFGDENKVNDKLPEINSKYLVELLNTLKQLNKIKIEEDDEKIPEI